MRRLKILLGGALLTLLVGNGYVFTSAASAGFILTINCRPFGIPTLCDEVGPEEYLEFEGEEFYLGSIAVLTETLIESKLGTEEAHVVCIGTIDVHGLLVQLKPLVVEPSITATTIKFAGCSLLEPLGKKCSVSTELSTKELVGKFSGSPSTVLFAPKEGTTVMELAFTNHGTETCPATIKGIKKLTGEQKCTNVSPETAATEHEIDCLESGSELKLAENAAELKLDLLVHLESLETTPWIIS
jgi:hypothetical protein